jgi:hypothetical protein
MQLIVRSEIRDNCRAPAGNFMALAETIPGYGDARAAICR